MSYVTVPTRPRKWWFRLLAEHELRSVVRTLDCLSDHTLRDIGLHRGDIVAGVRARARDR
jgi:uncharacterized protein YjiS (DUF1127 family)